MSMPEQPTGDPLRDLWLSAEGSSERERRLAAMLVEEKDRTVRADARRRRTWTIGVLLWLAFLTALQTRHPASFWDGVGLTASAVGGVLAAVGLWLGLRTRSEVEPGSATREYYGCLLDHFDRQLRFERSVKYWAAAPLLPLIATIGHTVLVNSGSPPAALGATAVIGLFSWLALRRGGIEAVERVRAERSAVLEWLADAGIGDGGTNGTPGG